MADIKISQLGSAITVDDSDIVPVVSGGNTLKATAAQLKEHAIGNTSISGIGDGSVTGAISALNTDKQPKTLATAITVDGTEQTTVEGALGAINTDLGSTKQALTTTRSSIAPVEDGTNYSQTYYKGDEFYRNGVLYKVTASSVNSSTAINTGSGGNATTADSISEQINDLNTVSVVQPNYQWIGLQVVLRSVGKTHYLTINGTLTNTLQASVWYDVANLLDFPTDSLPISCTCVDFDNGKTWRVTTNTATGKLQINPVETLEYSNHLGLFFTYVR